MTERLYYTDAFLTRFEATVTDLKDNGSRVYLDRTAFYPTSGGQPFDTGRMSGIPVIDVVDEGARVAHLLKAPLSARTTVQCEIDWNRRFDHMQQHSGQHLLSAVFADLLGHETTSVHFGPDYSTLDLDTAAVDPASVRRVEERANQLIFEDLRVVVAFEDAESASGLRKPPPRSGTIRVVTIEGTDRSACGGTHVRSTGQIGAVHLRQQEKVRGQARIQFLCGARAVQRARADFEALSKIAKGMSAAIDELPALLESQSETLRALQQANRRMQQELARHRAAELYASTKPSNDGKRYVVERAENGRTEEFKTLALAFVAQPATVMIVLMPETRSILLAASEDSGLDCGRVLREALAAVGGKGGGSARMAQGNVPKSEDLDTVNRAIGVPA